MGYDLYGVDPIGYDKGEYPVLTKWEDKTWDERQDMPEKDEDQYWTEMGKRDSETGGYFRANVWWWRRIWIFTCNVCFDVMTKDDIVSKIIELAPKDEHGMYEDEHWMANYPFNVEFFKEFTTFVERSGGFTIS